MAVAAMSREQKRGKPEKGSSDVAEKVVVAVKASKEIPKTALVWALTHVVQPGDCITLLVVVPSQSSGIFSCPVLEQNWCLLVTMPPLNVRAIFCYLVFCD